MTLTESFMMDPGASVCGLYFASFESRYFDVMDVDQDQFADYQRRNGWPESVLARSLGPVLRGPSEK